MDTLASIGEFGLIDKITKISNLNFPAGIVGPGDDCAVFAPGTLSTSSTDWQLITTDTMVENRHFRLSYYAPEDIGWKLMATAISDIAAMGGEPKVVVISLAIPKSTDVGLIEGIYRGIRAAEEAYGVLVVGGDTVSASELSIAATVVGTSKQAPLLRSGAKIGDDIWVSGEIGSAYAGLMLLEGLFDGSPLEADMRRHFENSQKRPEAQIELGKKLSDIGLITSMIDVSDGLLQDVSHIAEMSRVAAVIDVLKVPLSGSLEKLGILKAKAITGGEDYSLLFTAPQSARNALNNLAFGSSLSRIGEITATSNLKGEVLVKREGEVMTAANYLSQVGNATSTGFSHF